MQKIDNAKHPVYGKPNSGSVRVSVLSAIPELLSRYAIDGTAERIFAEIDLDPEILNNPENIISFLTGGRLLRLCSEHTEMPHFGMQLGKQWGPEVLGPLAALVNHAPTVQAALSGIIVHICIHDRGGVPTLTQDNGIARFEYAIYEPMLVGAREVYDTSISIMCNLMRFLVDETWAPSAVYFSHARPENIEPYESFYRAPVFFGSELNALIFPASCLKEAISTYDRDQYELILKQLAEMNEALGIDLHEKVHSIVRALVLSKNCKSEHVASILSIHPRTLNRRLESLGTTLREITGKTRFELAKQMLRDSDTQTIQVSTMLGYSSPSTFTRAFERWTGGEAPSNWRKLNKW